MRKLWNDTSSTEMRSSSGEETGQLQAEINELRNKVETYNNLLNDTIAALNDYKADNASRIDTSTLDALNGVIGSLSSSVINSDDIKGGTITSVDVIADTISSVNASISGLITALGISADNVTVNTLADITSANIDDAVIERLSVADLDITGTYTFSDIDATSVRAQILNADTSVIGDGTIRELHADEGDISDLTAEALTAASASLLSITGDRLDVTQITHEMKYIEPSLDEDYIIEVPYFRNGNYRLIGLDENNEAVAALDIRNDTSNIWLSWSRKPDLKYYIENVKIYDYISERPQCYIQCHENGHELRWYYQCSSYDNLSQPQPKTWDELPFDETTGGTMTYLFLHQNGVYFSHAVDILTNAGEHPGASLFLIPQNDLEEADKGDVEYNGTVDIPFKLYVPNQSVNEGDDVIFGNVTVTELDDDGQITEPRHSVSPSGITRTQDDVTDEYKPIDTTHATTDYDLMERWNDTDDRSELTDSPNLASVTSATIRNRHFFVGTQAEYTSYKTNLEDDSLVIIEG